jgi:predicted MFS family arabinose efflux permease
VPTQVRRALGAVFVARTAANAGLRIVYPFLPAIARGLDVTPGALASLIALRNLSGVTAPVAARIGERTGRRWMMLVSVGAVAVGCAVTASSSLFVVAGIGIVLVGIAKPAFDVSMQAWFGDRVPYSERGRVFGITELTWSIALLIVPLSGWLIAVTDWRAPFVLISVFALAGTVAVWRGIDSDRPHEDDRRPLELTGPRVRILAVAFLFTVASEIPFIVYGQWLEGSFGLSVTGIGAFTLAVVVAELIGEGAVVVVADRLGLKRMTLGGLVLSGVAYLGFSMTGASVVLGVLVVMVWIAAFEVTIVAAIPLVSELATEARGRLLSLLSVVVVAGRAVGALAGQPLYAAGGIAWNGLVAAACVGAAALLLLPVREPTGSTTST